MSAAIGMLAKMTVGGNRIDFLRESLACHEGFIDGNGLRGILTHDISRVREGPRHIEGQISFQPNGVEIGYLGQWIMGGTPTGSPTVTYPLADTLTTQSVIIDRNASSLFTYSSVAVDRATFVCDSGSPLRLDLDCVGIDETLTGSISGTIDATNGPWVFTDAVISINSTTVKARSINVEINNHIDRGRFFNSLTLTTLNKLDRTVSFRTLVPWGDFYALYGCTLSGGVVSGVSVVLTFTNANAVLTLTLANQTLPRQSPTVPGREEVMLPLEGTAYGSSLSANELAMTVNPGP